MPVIVLSQNAGHSTCHAMSHCITLLPCHVIPHNTIAQHAPWHTTACVLAHMSHHIMAHQVLCDLSNGIIPQVSSSFVLPSVPPEVFHFPWHCFRSQWPIFNSQYWPKIQDFQQSMYTCNTACVHQRKGIFFFFFAQDTVLFGGSRARMAVWPYIFPFIKYILIR